MRCRPRCDNRCRKLDWVKAMTSSSRSVFGRPKDAIGSLCQLMNLSGITGLNPEIFRQAKFNKPEAVAPLWSLLSSLISYSNCKCIGSGACTSHQATSSDVVSSTKHAMWSEGYRCHRFHRLPNDMSHGSRELLLALGWLLAKTDVLRDLAIEDSTHMVDTGHLHAEEVLQLRKQREEEMKKIRGSVDDARGTSCSGNYLAWLVGQYRMKIRRLYLQQQELCNLTHQIHAATQGISATTDTPHLSPLEVFILRHAEYSKKYQEILETQQARLRISLKWQNQEATFWRWMESVLDARMQDSLDEAEMPSECHTPCSAHSVSDLADLVMKLDGYTQRLERLAGDSDYNEEEDETWLRTVEEIRAKLVPISASPTCHLSILDYQMPRFHLIKKQSKTSGAQTARVKPSSAVHIQDEIARLSEVVDGLKEELASLRSSHHARLDELASVLPDSICIPPMGPARQ
ncbi:uncharacterized protein LOC110976800 [Acanthaster planci]|uniref:Uncharacterized protein LOC110976800 n=1 Tax=Acanthaster planci TaxID=133434 RepID=A0A8B7Y2D1_ACAPL|nr:uncharacterized protein LOC110976800 [Acanthaster planci]